MTAKERRAEVEAAVLAGLRLSFPAWQDFRGVHRYAPNVVDGHVIFTSYDTYLALRRLLRRGVVERRVFWRGCYGTAKWRLPD